MPQILVRNLESDVVERLKRRAAGNGRSLQAEVAQILRDASRKPSIEGARAEAERIRQRLSGRRIADSADLIREDREQ